MINSGVKTVAKGSKDGHKTIFSRTFQKDLHENMQGSWTKVITRMKGCRDPAEIPAVKDLVTRTLEYFDSNLNISVKRLKKI